MSKLLIKLTLFISIIMVVFINVVPHHTHGGVPCFVVEFCVDDCAFDDEHTSHPKADNDHEENKCVNIGDFVPDILKIRKHYDGNQLCFNDIHIHPDFTYILVLRDLFLYPDESEDDVTNYTPYINSYSSKDVNCFNGLRAPPAV